MSTFAPATTAVKGAGITPPFSAEFRCVLACLLWPLDDKALELLHQTAADVTDWRRFVAIAQRHRVTGLVAFALRKASIHPPADARNLLHAAAAEQTRQAMAHAAETIRVDRLLRAVNVEPIFLKGATLTLLAYGRLDLRHAKDVDVIVSEASAAQAIEGLKTGGYVPIATKPHTAEQMNRWLRFGKSMDWLNPATGGILELHWRMSDLPLLQGALASDTHRRVTLAGGSAVTTLDDDHLIAYLCVHGSAHGWSRLKWLADVYALLPHDAAALDARYRRALELGAGRSAGQALLLCHIFFRLPLEENLKTRLQRDPRLRLLVKMTLRMLARGHESVEVYDLSFGTSSIYLSRLLLGKGVRAAASEVATLLFPVEQVSLSRLPGFLLYIFPIVRAFRWIAERLRHGGRSRT